MSRAPFEIRMPRLEGDLDVDITAWDAEDLFDLKIPPGQKLDEAGEAVEDWSQFPFRIGAGVARGSVNELMLTGVEAFNAFGEDYGLKHISNSQSATYISSISDDGEHSLTDHRGWK